MALERERKIVFAAADGEAILSTGDEKSLDVHEASPEEETSPPLLFFNLPIFQWKTLFVFLVISLGIIFHWFSTSEIFDVPEDVSLSRSHFFKAKESYFHNRPYWDAKQRHFTEKLSNELIIGDDREVLREIQETPGEIFISFLLKKLHLSLDHLEQTAIFTREDASSCTVIISKPESSIWPLNIMLALELEVKVHAERFSLSVSRLRRGSQDIALALAWTYFGPELESIRQLESTTKQSFILLSTSDEQK